MCLSSFEDTVAKVFTYKQITPNAVGCKTLKFEQYTDFVLPCVVNGSVSLTNGVIFRNRSCRTMYPLVVLKQAEGETPDYLI